MLSLFTCIVPAGAGASDDWTGQDGWTFVVAPYAWLLGTDGDATIRGVEAEIDQDFSDLLSKLDVVVEGRLEAWKGDWGFVLDPTLGFFSDEAEVGRLEVDVDSTLTLVAFAVTRTLYRGPRAQGSTLNTKIEVGLGGVLTYADSEIDLPTPLQDPEFRESWVDGVVTLRGTTELGDRWLWRVAALVGGFGIGESSQLSLGLETYLGRSIGESRRIWIGYRALFLDHERGSGARKLDLELLMHGPVVGVSFRF